MTMQPRVKSVVVDAVLEDGRRLGLEVPVDEVLGTVGEAARVGVASIEGRLHHEAVGCVTEADHPAVNCCADVAPTQGMKSPPPGSVDKILESLRAQLADLRSDVAEVRPGGWRSIAQAREEAAVREECAAKAWEEVERLEQQARDVELAIERLS